MVKPEWGTKRLCPHCGARFYDMNRDPLTCPACSAAIDPVAQSRPRRTRAAPKLAAAAGEVAVAADDEDEYDPEEEGESAIEDVSELGDDDMADVIETDLDEDEGER